MLAAPRHKDATRTRCAHSLGLPPEGFVSALSMRWSPMDRPSRAHHPLRFAQSAPLLHCCCGTQVRASIQKRFKLNGNGLIRRKRPNKYACMRARPVSSPVARTRGGW